MLVNVFVYVSLFQGHEMAACNAGDELSIYVEYVPCICVNVCCFCRFSGHKIVNKENTESICEGSHSSRSVKDNEGFP